VFIEKVRLEVIDTKFESSQPLTDQRLRTVQGRDERVHQHRQVGQQRRETDGNCQAEFDEQIFHVLLVEAGLEAVQALEKVGKKRQKLLKI
jgi:hypothetical protein